MLFKLLDAKLFFPLLYLAILLLLVTSVSDNIFSSSESRLHHYIRGDRELDNKYLIVYIDEEDIDILGGWPISRDYYGYMAHALTHKQHRPHISI